MIDQPLSDRTKLMLVWPIAGFLVVIAFGVGLISMAAFGSEPEQMLASGTQAAGSAQRLEVELGDLFIKPETLRAEEGALTVEVTNTGKTEHNFAVEGLGSTEMIAPGDGATLTLPSVEVGSYNFLCEVAGHAAAGMNGTLIVGEGSGSDSQSSTNTHGMSAAEMARHDAAVTSSFPAETKGRGGVDLEPTPDGHVKVFELTADEVRWEVSPGEVKEAMAYNGMVPGPTIRAHKGDRVRIVLHNKLEEPTSLHFHGLTVPADMDGVPVISQDAVMPGDSFTYEFTVRDSGTHMYHSHFNAQSQVPMGLLGAFIVPDRDGPHADVDYNMVLNDGPLGFTLNGKGFPATQPLAVERGQTIRIRYMNEGFQIHPMHLHGLVQKVIAKDGHLLKHPYEADTVLVGPGERYDVLVEASEPGAWAWHCHVLSHAESEQGMFGMVTAVVVD